MGLDARSWGDGGGLGAVAKVERHARGGAVDRVAVQPVRWAMLEKALAVIGGHDHNGVFGEPELLESIENAAELGIGVRDLAVVGRLEARQLGRRRRVSPGYAAQVGMTAIEGGFHPAREAG